MTALELHGGQDWMGFAVVMGILAICLLTARLETRDWSRRQDLWLDRLIEDARTRPLGQPGPEVDHVDCANPDCDQTICACRKPAECTGCTTLGCDHGEGLCWDCRLGCGECAAEAYSQRAMDLAAGR